MTELNVPMAPDALLAAIDQSHQPTLPRLEPVNGLILEGERERTLTKILGAARRQGAHQIELRALADAINARCRPPLTGQDLDRLARSIARYQPDILDVAALLASVEAEAPKATPAPDLSFVTPVELYGDRQTHLDYVLQPYLIAGALTDFTGATKVGKTRLRNHLIRVASRGCPSSGTRPVLRPKPSCSPRSPSPR